MSGYVSTLLVKKLCVKANFVVHLIGAPANYGELLDPLPAGVRFEIREVALPLGFVAVKICAATDVWSAPCRT